MIALALLTINLVGYMLGPLLVALIARRWPGDQRVARSELSSLGVAVAVGTLIGVVIARRAVVRTGLVDESD